MDIKRMSDLWWPNGKQFLGYLAKEQMVYQEIRVAGKMQQGSPVVLQEEATKQRV